ncbi:MAG: YafY family transcriptional regulator [Acidobacteria bacterium]|nr:YafY family transcriptional regulator [Acidobacteriota bacterium]
MRADRLLSIMLLLQIYRRLTAGELARRLEVSERTIQRDMDALSTAGVPVTASRGSGGGWALVEGYRTNLTGLNGEEVQTLFAGLPDRLLADLNLGRASDAAHVKLLAALPPSSREAAEYARSRIHVDVAGWGSLEESLPHLHTIQEAVWRGRKLLLCYGAGHGDGAAPGERAVDPLGLVAKGGVWYLVARAGEDVRSYRVSRVASARLADEPAERPVDFDLAAFWAGSMARFREEMPRFHATFRAHGSVLHLLRYAGRFSRLEEASEPDAAGWATVRMRFQFEEDACGLALSFGTKVEVVEPPGLRAKIRKMAEEVVAFYEGEG